MSILDKDNYIKKNRLFFLPSKRFEAQITDLFDDIWPTITALKHFRWQFCGYINYYGEESVERIHDKFVEKDDKHNRPNLKRAFVEQTWEECEFRIAKNLLVNLFAYYEAWCDDILNCLHSRQKGKKLQYPTTGSDNYMSVLASLHDDADMNDYYNIYVSKNSKKNVFPEINNYLRYYRLFKECRNAIVHNDGVAGVKVVNAYNNINGIRLNSAHIPQVPRAQTPQMGQKVEFDLYNVVGFSKLILNMVTTFDNEFIKTTEAKNYLISEIRNYISSNHIQKISKIIPQLGFKSPTNWDDLVQMLNSNGCRVVK